MDDRHTRGWVLARIEFALAIGVIIVAAVLVLHSLAPTFGASQEWEPMALLVIGVVGFLGMLVGLAWMIHIYRGPRDEPPRWRYRDR